MNYSRQRKMIYDALCCTNEHPTADVIYRELREECPRLSLATVYRNLTQLCDAGMARRLRVNGSPDRFDANTRPHYHFCCEKCGEVSDVALPENILKTLLSLDIGCEVVECDVIYYGACAECAAEKEKIAL